MSFIDLYPRSLIFNIFKLLFFKEHWADWSHISCPRCPPCPYMLKNFQIFFSGTKRPMNLKLGMQHWLLIYYQVCSNVAPGLTLTYFTARSNLLPYAFVWEKIKWIFSEVIVVYDIKVCRCSQLNEYMKLYEYQRSRSFIDLDPNHSDSIFLIFLSSVIADFNIFSALRWTIQDKWSSGFNLVVLFLFCFV